MVKVFSRIFTKERDQQRLMQLQLVRANSPLCLNKRVVQLEDHITSKATAHGLISLIPDIATENQDRCSARDDDGCLAFSPEGFAGASFKTVTEASLPLPASPLRRFWSKLLALNRAQSLWSGCLRLISDVMSSNKLSAKFKLYQAPLATF